MRRKKKAAAKAFLKAFAISYVVTIGVALYFEHLLKKENA